ncbi:MAG: hypothetical protein IPK16_12585 [Anaerolineales bacterium]|nr:hypothetical protein [Anaerolineales bacterium]
MVSEQILLYGSDEPLPERLTLHAGPVTLTWEEGDLRTVKYCDKEVLRRVYVAIRDRNWGTVPNEITNLQISTYQAGFHISFDVANRQGRN